MSLPNAIARIQACIYNRLDRNAVGKKMIAGIIGDAPSDYAKSPSLWNAAFRALEMKAVYLPFDVDHSRLPELVQALKKSDQVMGVNVTVPYKVKIMEYLDGLDERARQIKAVNTIVRTRDGKLVGYNTDGKGFLESIVAPQPGREDPFVESLKGIDVLIIGAGGSARAVAFHLAKAMENGQLLISNRTPETARDLAGDIKKNSGNARAIKENEVPEQAPKAGLIINCSTKGQGGIRKNPDGKATSLEPYSALGPANPAAIAESDYGKPHFYRDWLSASLNDIEANNRLSLHTALSVPLHVGFCDLIYFPIETVFLSHGRLSGHRTMNGKRMNVTQAVDAFFHKVCGEYLKKLGKHNPRTYKRIYKIMWEAW